MYIIIYDIIINPIKLCLSISSILEGSIKSQTTIDSNSNVSTISIIANETASATTPTSILTYNMTGMSYMEINNHLSLYQNKTLL